MALSIRTPDTRGLGDTYRYQDNSIHDMSNTAQGPFLEYNGERRHANDMRGIRSCCVAEF